jgi:hypothetical protein
MHMNINDARERLAKHRNGEKQYGKKSYAHR